MVQKFGFIREDIVSLHQSVFIRGIYFRTKDVN